MGDVPISHNSDTEKMKRIISITGVALAIGAVAPVNAGDWDIVRPPGDGWIRISSKCDHAPVNPEPLACPKPGPSKRIDVWARAAGSRGQVNYAEFTTTYEGWRHKQDPAPLTYAINCDLWENKRLTAGTYEGDKEWQMIRPGTNADTTAKIACGGSF